MTGPVAFPDRPDDVTARWLTEALAGSFPGTEVAGVETLDEHSGTTGRLRLRLSYAPGPTGPDTVFVKLPPFDEKQRNLVAVTDMGRREARFYAGPAAEVPLRIPRAYFAAHGDDPAEYVMVLEDLEASGCRFTNRQEPLGAEGSGQLIEGLARLHAHVLGRPPLPERAGLGGAGDARSVSRAPRRPRPRAARARAATGVHRAVPLVRGALRTHLRAAGRGRADPDPRRHPRRQPVPRRRPGGPLRLGGHQPFAGDPRRGDLPRQLVPDRAAPRATRTSGCIGTTTPWWRRGSTHHPSRPCGRGSAER